MIDNLLLEREDKNIEISRKTNIKIRSITTKSELFGFKKNKNLIKINDDLIKSLINLLNK